MERFPTPPDALWNNLQIIFLDGHRVTAICTTRTQKVERTLNFTQMNMINRNNGGPDVQWKLLETLANVNGIITMTGPAYDPNNQKRVERLNKTLQQFFGIEGHAIVWDKNDRIYRSTVLIQWDDEMRSVRTHSHASLRA
ncbi:MAG: hypothetical protein HQL58_10910 [Magnetococcales bacterium]|nr:hypothetical protein [Magnetococcales bacterium]